MSRSPSGSDHDDSIAARVQGYDPWDVRNLAGIVLDAPTHHDGGAINVWLARDLARAALKQADEVDDLRREISRREGYAWVLENRIEAAKLALGGHAEVDVLFDAEPTT